MIHRLSTHLRANCVAYLALAIAVIGSGGSYAVAATARSSQKHRPTTIAACVNNRTGELVLDRSKRCSRGHHKLTWAIKGPKGATGAAGAPAPSIYASVDATSAVNNNPSVPEKGLAVQRTGLGTYAVTVTDPVCATGQNIPVVTASADYAVGEGPLPPNVTPVAYISNNIGITTQFTIDTGYTAGGSFVPADLGFNVLDTCMPPSKDHGR